MNISEALGTFVLRRLARVGTLHLTLPSQKRLTIGTGLPEADLEVLDYSVLPDVLRTGLTGFAEAYMDERVTTAELPALFAWGGANQRAWFEHPLARATVPLRRVWQRVRPEKRHQRVRTMNDHYNLGNDFYSAWLDDTMTYSSAKFTGPDQSLTDAQRNKYRTIADHAELKPGMRVLEIGCGWGGFSEYAASERGCQVTAITLSEKQAAYARQRIADANLSDVVEIRIQDFREVSGEFDAVVSIEMIESVDESNWKPLFATIKRSLKPGAIAAMQIITIVDDAWDNYRTRTDFIQQYIFPGGQVPAPKILRTLSRGEGLSVEQVETFGLDYARTLATWREQFVQNWPTLKAKHDLDTRFQRMWDVYLSLCEAGFRMGRTNVEHWVFSR